MKHRCHGVNGRPYLICTPIPHCQNRKSKRQPGPRKITIYRVPQNAERICARNATRGVCRSYWRNCFHVLHLQSFISSDTYESFKKTNFAEVMAKIFSRNCLLLEAHWNPSWFSFAFNGVLCFDSHIIFFRQYPPITEQLPLTGGTKTSITCQQTFKCLEIDCNNMLFQEF